MQKSHLFFGKPRCIFLQSDNKYLTYYDRYLLSLRHKDSARYNALFNLQKDLKKISLIYRLVRVVLENKCRRDWKTI